MTRKLRYREQTCYQMKVLEYGYHSLLSSSTSYRIPSFYDCDFRRQPMNLQSSEMEKNLRV